MTNSILYAQMHILKLRYLHLCIFRHFLSLETRRQRTVPCLPWGSRRSKIETGPGSCNNKVNNILNFVNYKNNEDGKEGLKWL